MLLKEEIRPAPDYASAILEKRPVTPPESFLRETEVDFNRQKAALGQNAPQILPLLDRLHGLITGKHVPGKSGDLAAALLSGLRASAIEINLILASPTAVRELPYMLYCAETVAEFIEAHVVVHVLRWETTCDCERPVRDRKGTFRGVVADVHELLNANANSPFEVRAYNIDIIPTTAAIRGPWPFELAAEEVRRAKNDPASADARLVADLVWTEAFYVRQDSLRKYGPSAAMLDLAIRRGVGHSIAANFAQPRLILSSERKARLTKTYELPDAALNVFIPSAT